MVATNFARVVACAFVPASYCAPDRREGKPHLCQHCDALYAFMTMEQVRREVLRILRAHAAKLERAAMEQKRGR